MPKISELTEIPSGSVADDDVLPIVDDTDDSTKRTKVSSLNTYIASAVVSDTAFTTAVEDAANDVIDDNLTENVIDISSGSVVLSSVTGKLASNSITGANSSNTVTLPAILSGIFTFFNESATDTVDIERGGSTVFSDGTTTQTIAANGVLVIYAQGSSYILLS